MESVKKDKTEESGFSKVLESLGNTEMDVDERDAPEEIDQLDVDEPTVWAHNKLDFLKPDKIKDIKMRRPDHKDYDPTTLHVPDSYLKQVTPVGFLQFY